MRSLRQALAVLVFAASSACVHVQPTPTGPEAVARDFATRLEKGELEQAWALSTGISRETFFARYADANERAQRANAVAHAAAGEAGAGGVQLTFGNEGWRVLEAPEASRSDADVQKALTDFLDAAERRDFPTAWTMLSAKWRARYTPTRLQTDFDAEPQVKERLARARAALGGTWKVERDSAALGLGEGRTLRLEREGELWRVAALE
jgi:hypothetical protein